MADMLRRRVRWAARYLLAAGVASFVAGPVQAFFFFGWPGDGLSRPQTLVPANAPKEGNPPSAQVREEVPPGDVPRDARPTPTEVPPESPPPVIPEPTTLILAGMGIGVIVAVRVRRAAHRPEKV